MISDSIGLRSRLASPVTSMLGNDFVRHGALVFGAAMSSNVLNYLFNAVISRRVGVEGFATLSSLVSLLVLLSIPTSVLTLVVVKYAAIFSAVHDSPRLHRLSSNLMKWTAGWAVVVFVVGYLTRNYIASFLKISDDTAIVLSLAIMSIGLITPSVRGVLQGEQDFVRYGVSTVLETLVKAACGLALVFAGFGVVGAMAGWTAGTICGLVYTVYVVVRKHPAPTGTPTRLALDLRRVVTTTVGVGLSTTFLTAIGFMDVLLVKHYFSAHDAGLYAGLNLAGKVVLFVVSFVPAVVLPKAVTRTTRGESGLPLLLQALAVTGAISGVSLLFAGTVPAEILRVLAGRHFVSVAPLVLQYDASMALLGILTLLVNYRIGVHRFGFLYALGAVLAGELIGIALFHDSLAEVIHILIAGNAIAILACLLGLRGRYTLRSPAAFLAHEAGQIHLADYCQPPSEATI